MSLARILAEETEQLPPGRSRAGVRALLMRIEQRIADELEGLLVEADAAAEEESRKPRSRDNSLDWVVEAATLRTGIASWAGRKGPRPRWYEKRAICWALAGPGSPEWYAEAQRRLAEVRE
jgi:hypothetical protein